MSRHDRHDQSSGNDYNQNASGFMLPEAWSSNPVSPTRVLPLVHPLWSIPVTGTLDAEGILATFPHSASAISHFDIWGPTPSFVFDDFLSLTNNFAAQSSYNLPFSPPSCANCGYPSVANSQVQDEEAFQLFSSPFADVLGSFFNGSNENMEQQNGDFDFPRNLDGFPDNFNEIMTTQQGPHLISPVESIPAESQPSIEASQLKHPDPHPVTNSATVMPLSPVPTTTDHSIADPICPLPDCAYTCPRTRDLHRHLASNHPEYCSGVPALQHLLDRPICPISWCPRARNGFARKDHLKRHLRRKHPRYTGEL